MYPDIEQAEDKTIQYSWKLKVESWKLIIQLFNYSIIQLLKNKKVREGQTVDALALGGDEGRDKLR